MDRDDSGIAGEVGRVEGQYVGYAILQHGRDREQTAIGGQIPAGKVIACGRPDFKGIRNKRANRLPGALFLVMLSIVIHLLGDS